MAARSRIVYNYAGSVKCTQSFFLLFLQSGRASGNLFAKVDRLL